MTIAIVHDDEHVYIQMSPEKFERLLVKYLVDYTPSEALTMIINELKMEALTK